MALKKKPEGNLELGKNLKPEAKQENVKVEEKQLSPEEIATRKILAQVDEAMGRFNMYPVAANEQAKELGFIGEEIKKISDSDASNVALVQGKLEEIKAYLLAVKEATDASSKEALNQIKGLPSAIVKSWLEVGEERK